MPIRWALVRDPDGKRAPQAFFGTDITLEPAEIIALFVRRWQIRGHVRWDLCPPWR